MVLTNLYHCINGAINVKNILPLLQVYSLVLQVGSTIYILGTRDWLVVVGPTIQVCVYVRASVCVCVRKVNFRHMHISDSY